jgi:hypothetical protein
VAWKAGLVQPLLKMTLGLAARLAALLSPQLLLGGLVAIPAFLAGLSIGKVLERQFDISSLLLKIAAWGKGIIKMMGNIAVGAVQPFYNLGKAITEGLMSGKGISLEQVAGIFDPKEIFAKLEGQGAAIKAEIDKEMAAIATQKNDAPEKPFLEDLFDQLVKDVEEFPEKAKALMDDLTAKLQKILGIDITADAVGQLFENFKNDKPKGGPIAQIGDDAEKGEQKVEALNLAVKKASGGGGSVFRGGSIANFDEGAQFKKPANRFAGAAGLVQEFRGRLRGGKPIDGALPKLGAAAGAERLALDFAGIKPGKVGGDSKTAVDSLKTAREQLAELKKLSSSEAGRWY